MSSKRIVAGTLASYLNTGISMLSNLILVPMYLYYLGKEQYGLWIVVLSIVSYLGFSNLGIAQIVSNLVAGANSKRDYNGIKAIVATGFWLYMAIVFIVFIFVIAAAIFAPIGNLFKVSVSLKKVVTPVLIISSAFFLLQLPLTIFRVTLRSLNLIYKEQLLGIIFTTYVALHYYTRFSDIIQVWEARITSRITQRVLKNISTGKGHPKHPEALLPEPKYMIMIDTQGIINLTPQHLKEEERGNG